MPLMSENKDIIAEPRLRVVIINKSDSTGGAAVVSRRLMESLRGEGVDARMLVVEKLTHSPYIELAASPRSIKRPFLAERLKIFMANGFDRSTLFKIDTGSDGLPLWEHHLVKEADAVLINWVNQGMLSLKGVEKIIALGKPVIWTMHDMWCMTGICHHAGDCRGYLKKCGNCPLLGKRGGDNDLSHKIWEKKRRLGSLQEKITFVAVSNWLAGKAKESSLLAGEKVCVIPNPFNLSFDECSREKNSGGKIRLIFGAARVDDPIKGLPVLVEATKLLRTDYPELASRMELVTFGGVKDPSSLSGMGVESRHLGMVKGEDEVRKVYESADILVSASSYETLPGTLVEAQAYGCIPVSCNPGGQSDIVEHLSTGHLAHFSSDLEVAARNLAEGIVWAVSVVDDEPARAAMLARMRDNVKSRFLSSAVAGAYVRLICGRRNV